MQEREITDTERLIINGVKVTCFADGSIEKPNRKYKDNRLERTLGGRRNDGYKDVRLGGKLALVHRLIAEAFLPDWDKDLQVDHINGDKSDNRLENLRMVTNAENCKSFQRARANSSSPYRGVCAYNRDENWVAKITINYKLKHLGYFDCEQAAAVAYDRAAEEAGFGEQALNRTNHPELALLSGAY